LSRTFPDDAEAGGGLYVAVIQFAIMIGATAGGFLYDQASWTATFCLAGVLLVGSAFMTIVAAQNRSRGR
jgi:predicted MFS family arabinose efflux permease